MPKYIVTTTGTWRNIIEVEADGIEEAKELADDYITRDNIDITGVDEVDVELSDEE